MKTKNLLFLLFGLSILCACTSNSQIKEKEERHLINEKELPFPENLHDEVLKIKDGIQINYWGMDSLIRNGADPKQVYTDTTNYRKLISYVPLVKEFVHRKTRTSTYQYTLLDIAISAFDSRIGFESHPEERSDELKLIDYLFSNGFNPNEDGWAGINKILESAEGVSNLKAVKEICEVYEQYHFDFSQLDLSICKADVKLMQYLLEKGVNRFDMTQFDFINEVKYFYENRENLKGIQCDFSNVTGDDFPFESDTLKLQLFLEMGLSPNHKTSSGKALRNDFSSFRKSQMRKVLDEYLKSMKQKRAI